MILEFMRWTKHQTLNNTATHQIAGIDQALEKPIEDCIAFATLQVKFTYTTPATRRFNSTVRRMLESII